MAHTHSSPKSASLVLLTAALATSVLTLLPLLESELPHPVQTMQFTDSPSVLTERDTTREEVEVDRVGVLAIAFAGSVAIGAGLNWLSKRRSGGEQSVSGRKVAQPVARSVSLFDQANRSLQRKLMLLLHNDRQAAIRLLRQAELKFPGHNADWYMEKVIFDLKRDRGKY